MSTDNGASARMHCPECYTTIERRWRFCLQCGASLVTERGDIATQGTLGDLPTAGLDARLAALKQGSVIDARFEIRGLLGSGGMGSVYKVFDHRIGQECALKVMHPQLLSSEAAARRFVREAQVSLGLTHPNIVRVYDIGNDGGLWYLSMELLEGKNLRTWLNEHKARRERPPVGVASAIMRDVLSALEYAHERVVHCDLKPENVFLEQDARSFRAKVLDFGIAHELLQVQQTLSSAAAFTPLYAAPEQTTSTGSADARTDLFSVGIILHELLTGTLPRGVFAAPSAIRPELSQEWDAVVRQACEPDPAKRWQNAAEMRARIASISAAMTSRKTRRMWLAVLAILIVLGPAAALLGIELSNRQSSRQLDELFARARDLGTRGEFGAANRLLEERQELAVRWPDRMNEERNRLAKDEGLRKLTISDAPKALAASLAQGSFNEAESLLGQLVTAHHGDYANPSDLAQYHFDLGRLAIPAWVREGDISRAEGLLKRLESYASQPAHSLEFQKLKAEIAAATASRDGSLAELRRAIDSGDYADAKTRLATVFAKDPRSLDDPSMKGLLELANRKLRSQHLDELRKKANEDGAFRRQAQREGEVRYLKVGSLRHPLRWTSRGSISPGVLRGDSSASGAWLSDTPVHTLLFTIVTTMGFDSVVVGGGESDMPLPCCSVKGLREFQERVSELLVGVHLDLPETILEAMSELSDQDFVCFQGSEEFVRSMEQYVNHFGAKPGPSDGDSRPAFWAARKKAVTSRLLLVGTPVESR